MKRAIVGIWIVVLAAVTCFGADGFEPQNFNGLPYRLLKPRDYDAKKKYPLVLFLHGAGERGADNGRQLIWFVNLFAVPAIREKFPCFVAAPQCPAGQQWVDTPWSLPGHVIPAEPSAAMAKVLELPDALCKTYSIDNDRIYAIGMSMGGFGVWDLLARRPQLFAAGVPICGGGDEATAPKFAQIPVWAFHGAMDPVVMVSRSRNMIAALKKAGGNPKYTEYPTVRHSSWIQVAGDPELLPWLFAQKRSAAKSGKTAPGDVPGGIERDPRSWTSKTGARVEASLVETQGGCVTAVLKKADGSSVSIRLDSLSDADRDYVLSCKTN